MKKFAPLIISMTALAASVFIPASSAFAAPEDYGDFDMEYYGRFKDKNMAISVYNWGEYLSDGSDGLIDICAEFEALTGITVFYTNFATNEELYAKLKSGGAVYDVIFPSDYMVSRMIEEDMLAPLDMSNIPNFALIDPKFTDPGYDPGCRYSIPYTWNTVAIIYNTSMVEEVPDSWDALWDERYKGKILMFSNSRDAFAIACKKLGFSMNTEDPGELRQAAEILKQQKPLLQAYVMDQIFDKMENNEAAIAPYYAGDAALMQENNEDIEISYPKEGTNFFVDAVAVPANSAAKEAAEMFINFINEPAVAAENIEYIAYSTPNTAAYELLSDEIKEDETIYPPEEVLASSEQMVNLSAEANLLMDELWTEVLSTDESFVDWGLSSVLTIVAIVAGKAAYRKKKRDAYRRMVE